MGGYRQGAQRSGGHTGHLPARSDRDTNPKEGGEERRCHTDQHRSALLGAGGKWRPGGGLKVPLRGGGEGGEQGRAPGGRGAPRAALTVSLLAVDHPHQQGRVAGELQGSKRQGCARCSDPAALP